MEAVPSEADARADKALAILAEVRELVENARSMPMTTSVLVPGPQMLMMLDALNEAIPVDLWEADDVLSSADSVLARAQDEADTERSMARHAAEDAVAAAEARAKGIVADANRAAEDIVAEARAEADALLARANARAEEMVSKDAIVLAAQQRAAQLEQEATGRARAREEAAKKKADSLVTGANEYADSVLAALVSTADAVRGEAEAGREEIARRLSRSQGKPAFAAVTPQRKPGAAWQVSVEEN
ncbi:hypothetical protein [Buchananella felis]|uniref:hypothetical protein n=1 Tax=Buchananella felis TaxID=3231492 RepID=UPI003529B3FA